MLNILPHPSRQSVLIRASSAHLRNFQRCLSVRKTQPFIWRRINLGNYAFRRVRLPRLSDGSATSASGNKSSAQHPSLNKPRRPSDPNSSVRASVTWLTRDPALVDLEKLRLELPRYCDNKSLVKLVVLLVTPSLASLIDPGAFFQHVLTSLYAGRRSFVWENPIEKPIKCVTAVVDALPVPPETPSNSDGDSARAAISDGLALFMSSESFDARSVYAPSELLDDAENKPTATLKFCSTPEVSSSALASDQGPPVRHVTLPAANTIFVNGQRATLFQDLWRIRLTDSEEPSINYLGRKNLKSFQLNLQCPEDSFVNGGSAPLHILTKPRKVVRSMGNVLRQIEVDGEGVPASQELEKAVSAYIKANPASTARSPLLVFALIRPPGTLSFEEGPDGNNDIHGSGSLKSLWHGAQLFKVSGGGGGWGKRQGLLSLEAAVGFETTEVAPSLAFPDFDNDQNVLHELSSRGIVPTGSTVEFLVCSADLTCKDTSRASLSKPAPFLPTEDGTTVVLGTATDPDSQDGMLEGPNVTNAGVIFLPDYFGMVSYGGAALGTNGSMSTRLKPSAISRTRCDVPNARFIIRGVGSVRQPRSKEKE
ncbi:uncharacterized protein PV07_12490 [Cladophialophora immunda]|uniref:Uncharacterized protein n=1 Tax=Cladophialophora immunda TaxID=569365 RepID=A0A0D1Z3D3_9EURO|nr:uncharacterized protein PV07_12490 [Cladophialophora immunda]KIW22171.1 hypothetical protein PV07_12490 [Cladophialophora immunda]